ncbi:MAG TPA: hypothetical protein VD968_17450, partial [Pyrinomonadaceae bacterium]|nr:hypothetical protein [Pyrinomonadaceae bacterium]
MNKERLGLDSDLPELLRQEQTPASRLIRLGLVGALGASVALCQTGAPRAQQRWKEPEVKVTGVSVSGSVVSISADGPLTRAQTFQTPDGVFHVVVVNGKSELQGGAPRGVKLQRISNSLELTVPVRPGASVTVQPRGNRLDLVVSGGQGGALNVENFETGRQAEEGGEEERGGRRPGPRAASRGTAATTRPREMPSQASRAESPQPSGRHDKKERGTQTDAEHAAGGAPKGATQPAEQPVAAGAGGDAPPQQEASAVARASEPEVLIAPAQAAADEGVSVGSLLFSLPSLLGALGLA